MIVVTLNKVCERYLDACKGVLETNAEKTVTYAHTRKGNVAQNQKLILDCLVTYIRFV